MTRDCKASVAAMNQRARVENPKATITCYDYGRTGHFRNECQKLRNQNQVNQIWKEKARENSSMDISKITRKQSKTGKHGHENGRVHKSRKQSQEKVNPQSNSQS
ncbi:reverse transcriptase domain-containing protein [Tanacetum coccineum]|uniref:Reverse transcriptase domain-containing protein n=1 Tax=Tanacetum coccineum TaxID=301880 RepID=A0ABQ5H443_9ASTR